MKHWTGRAGWLGPTESAAARAAALATTARLRRWAELLRRFPALAEMRVLDLGGTPAAWQAAPCPPAQVVTLNLRPGPEPPEPWLRSVQGDACDPPAWLRRDRFDLVYSNSVIEHVGGHARRQAFAGTAQAAADRHWVQTPYRYFPIEPHWHCPGFQFLPVPGRVLVSRWWPLGHPRPADRRAALADVCSVELLTATELQGYFPDSALWRDRRGGLTKYIVAIRGQSTLVRIPGRTGAGPDGSTVVVPEGAGRDGAGG